MQKFVPKYPKSSSKIPQKYSKFSNVNKLFLLIERPQNGLNSVVIYSSPFEKFEITSKYRDQMISQIYQNVPDADNSYNMRFRGLKFK